VGLSPRTSRFSFPATFPNAIQSFVQALGLADQRRCSYCHIEDRASAEKIEKVTARNMIIMVRELNARFPDGKQHVVL
jgi:hypothetical protein